MKIWRNKFVHILLVEKEIASLVGNFTVPLNIAPQLHKRLAHMGIFIPALLATTQQVGGGKQSMLWNTIQPLQRVVPTAGKNWEGIPSEQHMYCLGKISKMLLRRKKQVGIYYVQQTKPKPIDCRWIKKRQERQIPKNSTLGRGEGLCQWGFVFAFLTKGVPMDSCEIKKKKN